MREYYPLIFVGAIAGVFSLIFLGAWWRVRQAKAAPDFDRHIPDGEIIRRLMKYALPYKKEFLLVLVVMLVSISYELISPLIMGRVTALIKDAPILILDDSVSAVDTQTDRAILDNLRQTRQGRTTILIAHRISTVEQMDKIIFLEDGRVTAVGAHQELYDTCPAYHRMVELQKLEEEGAKHNA